MKWKLSLFTVLTLAIAGITPPARAVTVLDDKALAAVKGGFCPFEKCETGTPTGVCQPILPTESAVCGLTACVPQVEHIGPFTYSSCKFIGKYTCTLDHIYRRCILTFTTSVCWNSNDTNFCGVVYEPICAHKSDDTCECRGRLTEDPCDWTNCLPESS